MLLRNLVLLLSLLCTIAAQAQDGNEADTILISDSSKPLPYIIDTDGNLPLQENPLSEMSWPHVTTSRKVPDSITGRLKRQSAFEYANDPAYWIRQKRDDGGRFGRFLDGLVRFFLNPFVRSFLILLIIGLVLYAIIRGIIVNNLYVFGRSSRRKKKSGDTDPETEMMNEDFDIKIKEALAKNNQRLAVRYLYLKTLKILDTKGWIKYQPKTTNQEYRTQVNEYARGKEFGFLASVYEYMWYGNFELNGKQLEKVINQFNHFHNVLAV